MLHHGLSRANTEFPHAGNKSLQELQLVEIWVARFLARFVRRLAESCGVLRSLAEDCSSITENLSVSNLHRLIHSLDASSKAPTLAAWRYACSGICMRGSREGNGSNVSFSPGSENEIR